MLLLGTITIPDTTSFSLAIAIQPLEREGLSRPRICVVFWGENLKTHLFQNTFGHKEKEQVYKTLRLSREEAGGQRRLAAVCS